MSSQEVRVPWRGEQSPERESFIDEFSPLLTIMEDIFSRYLKSLGPHSSRIEETDPIANQFVFDLPGKHFKVGNADKVTSIVDKAWLHGDMGSGKTTASASITHALLSQAVDLDAVCFYSCSLLSRKLCDSVNVLRTLIGQLGRQSVSACQELQACVIDAAPPSITAEPGNHWPADGFDYLYHEPLLALFESMTRHFSRVTLVFANVDQYCCKTEPDAWRIFVSYMTEMTTRTGSRIRVLFTSAPTGHEDYIFGHLGFAPVLVAAQPDEIKKHITHVLVDEAGSSDANESLVRRVQDCMAVSARGSWLRVASELELVCQYAKDACREGPLRLPTGVEAIENVTTSSMAPYASHIESVLGLNCRRSEIILDRVLSWVGMLHDFEYIHMSISQTCDALRLVLIKELHNHGGVAPRTGSGRDGVDANEVLAICGPLVRASVCGTTFEYSHVAVHGFLSKHVSDYRPEVERFRLDDASISGARKELATLCLETLADPSLAWMPSRQIQDSDNLRRRDQDRPFYGFSAAHWFDLCDDLDEDRDDWGHALIADFVSPVLETGNAAFASWFIEHRRRRFASWPSFAAPEWGQHELLCTHLYEQLAAELSVSCITALHAAAGLALGETCAIICAKELGRTANDRSPTVGSPLYCALLGPASLAPGMDMPRWQRFMYFEKVQGFDPGATIQVAKDLLAVWNQPTLHAPDVELGRYSLLADLFATCSWMHNDELFISIVSMDHGPLLDYGFIESLRNRTFMIRPRSMPMRPVPGIVWGVVADFLASVYPFLTSWANKRLQSRSIGREEPQMLNDMKEIILRNAYQDNLPCVEELQRMRG